MKKINMYPLLKKQSKDLQLEVQSVLIEKVLMKGSDVKPEGYFNSVM